MSRPREKKARGVFALVLLACLAAACSGKSPADPGASAAALKKREAPRVRAEPVVQREMVRTLESTTVVESEKEIKLFPRASGTLLEMKVEEGDSVEAGAVLALLDAREAQAKVDEARVALQEAQDSDAKLAIQEREAQSKVESARLGMEQKVREYDRNEKAAGIISEQALDQLRLARDTSRSDFDAAKLALERAQADTKASKTTQEKSRLALERAQLDLSYTQVVAPFAGVIAQRSVKVGDQVSPATQAFVLTDAQNLRAVFYRPQRELALFQPAAGQQEGLSAIEIRASAEALPGVALRGQIQLVSPSIDAQSGNFRVTARLETAGGKNEPRKLLPGMLVKLSIVTDRHPGALVVPKRALRREGEANLLFVVREGHARRVEVDEGFTDDQFEEVIPHEGFTLAPGEAVVVVGNRELEDGAEVELEASAPKPVEKPADKPAAENAAAPAPQKG
ncbi:MAG: efflux RND transporter periplasmic adaptor subunit [Planctomycetes bacterium]|nr:efflux RND transporter periplasmic adaptor subunit [Planctomycetota bacterium]